MERHYTTNVDYPSSNLGESTNFKQKEYGKIIR